ncbi:hypothetical protein [Nocardia wallacei]|uniref:hypothetical protein n=1 Tax=Nocardia wallacei TaxID=480035 RepID=UPI002453A496|nr:hypothetical protein [Nocardia wallacei]
MSFVTNFVLYVADGDSATQDFLEAVAETNRGVVPERVPDEGFPGPKFFEGCLYAAVGNYWDTRDMQALVDEADWDDRAQVVVICCTEDNPAKVYRPSGWRD